ncbi:MULTISPECIES: hypothetical protein [unclassified Nocardia]|uniref:hypothetical protein n=1 Tax=unclassified Nocardia TaxID=2637762 RepID=UPI00278C2B12|nr:MULTISPECIES: hypothetical protein [unclassified Nocardia]
MTGEIRVDPQQVREAATIADSIRAELHAIAEDARTAVSPGSTAWGDDKFGGRFANGDTGFEKGSDSMASGTDALSTSFGNLITGLTEAAQRLEAMEQANISKFA